MTKITNKFRDTYIEYNDLIEHIATYGLDGLTDQELTYARKLYEASSEFIDAFQEEESALTEKEEEEEEQ